MDMKTRMSFYRHALAGAYAENYFLLFDKMVYEKCSCSSHHHLRSRHQCFDVGMLDFLKSHLLDFKDSVDDKMVTEKFIEICRKKQLNIKEIPDFIFSKKYRDWLFLNPYGYSNISNNVFTSLRAWYTAGEYDLFRIYCLNQFIELNPYSEKRSDFLKVWFNKIEYELIKLVWGLIKQKTKRTESEMFAHFGLCYLGCDCVTICSRQKLQGIFNGEGMYGKLMRKEMDICK